MLATGFVCLVVGYLVGLLHGRQLSVPREALPPEFQPMREIVWGSNRRYYEALQPPVIINATQYNRGGPCS